MNFIRFSANKIYTRELEKNKITRQIIVSGIELDLVRQSKLSTILFFKKCEVCSKKVPEKYQSQNPLRTRKIPTLSESIFFLCNIRTHADYKRA